MANKRLQVFFSSSFSLVCRERATKTQPLSVPCHFQHGETRSTKKSDKKKQRMHLASFCDSGGCCTDCCTGCCPDCPPKPKPCRKRRTILTSGRIKFTPGAQSTELKVFGGGGGGG